MKKYFVDGEEITESEAMQISDDNMKFLDSENIEDLAKCRFIIAIDYDGKELTK